MERITNILVAIDYSDHVKLVMQRAVDLAQRYAADLHLIHVVELLPPMVMGDEPFSVAAWSVDEGALVNQAQKRMDELVASLDNVTVSTSVETGRPVEQICQFANDRTIDLIIAGSHGRKGFDRLLGSTASALVHKAPCDLFLVKIK